MKLIGIPILISAVLFGLMLLLDKLQGRNTKTAIHYILNPFSVMRPAEIFVFTILSILLIVYYWVILSKRKQDKENTAAK